MTPVADAFMSGQRPRYIGPELRGPADADGFRVKVGRYGDRWYHNPLPGDHIAPACETVWPSVSTVKKASGNDWSFTALKRVADALDTDKYRNLARWPYADRYEALKAINKIGLNAAGQRGTNIHLMFEAFLHGQPCPISEGMPGYEYRGAVEQFFAQYNPTLVAAEFVCIHHTLNGVGYGGTGDAIIELDGLMSQRMRCLVDWKSRGVDSEHGAYPEEAAQVGALAGADYIIVEGRDGPERRLMPELDGGLIVSVKPDGCRIYPIDLDKGFQHWSALHAWWVARRDEREPVGRQWPARKNVPGDGVGTSEVAGIADQQRFDSSPAASPGTPDVEGEAAASPWPQTPSVTTRPRSSPSTPVSPQATQSPAAVNAGGVGSSADQPPHPPVESWEFPTSTTVAYREALAWASQPSHPPATIEERTEQLLADLFTPDPVVVAAVAVASDAVDAACNKPFTPDHTEALAWASQPAPTPLAPLPDRPDEGEGGWDFHFLETQYKALDAVSRAWIARLVSEAQQANVGFHTQRHRTARRYWVIEGLVDLAKAGSPDDDVLRALCVAALTSDAPLDTRHTPGACVGSLDAAAAQRFAALVDDFVAVKA